MGSDDVKGSRPAPANAFSFDTSLVLVAGRSVITRVVVGRIAERSGLHPIAGEPDRAAMLLATHRPGLVVADVGAEGRDCADLVEAVAGMRRAGGQGLPLLVALTGTNSEPGRVDPGGTVNAVVAKPITPDSLQPVIEILLEPHRS